mmetsp:Transcript_2151/g.5870  ORF Transcript_2151/g.5870 Transcript_2151/m.5870 type:complete len:335 (+) Transcript_2151:141-1145(+)
MALDVGPQLLQELQALFPHLLAVRNVRQPEHRLDLARHGKASVDPNGIWLLEKPGDEVLNLLIELGLSLVAHELGEDSRNHVGGHGDDSDGSSLVAGIVGLVVVAAPAGDPLGGVISYPLISLALLDPDEVIVTGYALHDVCSDVLARPRRHVVDHSRAQVHRSQEMLLHPSLRSLPVVRIDLQGGVHPHVEPLLGRVECLSRAVTPRVAYHLDLSSIRVHRVRDQHDVLVPRHQLTLSRRSTDYHALHSVLYLILQELVVAHQVELPVWKVRRLERGDEASRFELLHGGLGVESGSRRNTAADPRRARAAGPLDWEGRPREALAASPRAMHPS